MADIKKEEAIFNSYRYVQQLKSPELAALSSIFLPLSLGHAVAGDWKRGAPFLAADILMLGVFYSCIPYYRNNDVATNHVIVGGLATAFALSKVWEAMDAFSTAEEHNDRLTKQYRQMMYRLKQPINTSFINDYRNPLIPAISSFFIPSLGQALSGDWFRGIPFLGGAILGTMLKDKYSENKYSMSRLIILTSALWGAIDAYQFTEGMNSLSETQYNIMLGPSSIHQIDWVMAINFQIK
ncbi:hypothetical protein HOH45_05195 [bacterium]|nr:hypothetical protein [bacterium]